MNLGSAQCQNVRLTDKYVLQADCTSPSSAPPDKLSRTHLNLDLNNCFANYKGTLNRAKPGGGFGASCPSCTLDDKYTMHCDCETGNGNETMKTEYDLNNWHPVRISGYSSSNLKIDCFEDAGINDDGMC